MSVNSYRNYNKTRSNKSKTNRRNALVFGIVMIVISLTSLIIGTIGFSQPKSKNNNFMAPNARAGWNDAWSDYESFTENFSGGDGKWRTPYLISNPAQMARFAYVVNHKGGSYLTANYKLTANINMSARRWDPIGRMEFDSKGQITLDRGFGGVFDGGGYVITGISAQNKSNRNYGRTVGMFGYLKSGGVGIENFVLNNASLEVTTKDSRPYGAYLGNSGGVSAGIIAAYAAHDANVLITNITINSPRIYYPETQMPGFDVGGVLGFQSHNWFGKNQTVYPDNSESQGAKGAVEIKNVNVKNASFVINSPTTGRDFSNKDESFSNSSVGGLVGGARHIEITDSSFTGGDIITVGTSNELAVGGIIGTAHSGHGYMGGTTSSTVLINVRATGRFDIKNTTTTNLGGLVGELGETKSYLIIRNGYAEASLKADIVNNNNDRGMSIGGIAGMINNSNMYSSFEDVEFEGQVEAVTPSIGSSRTINAGGMFGYLNLVSSKVVRGKSNAKIIIEGGYSQRVGGVIGVSGWGGNMTIEDVTAIGEVANPQFASVGGFAGNESSSAIHLNKVYTSISGAGDKLFGFGELNADIEDSWQEELLEPKITQQPEEELQLITGQTANLSITAEANKASEDSVDKATFSYQWFTNTIKSTEGGLPMFGQTKDTLRLATSKPGQYFVYARAINMLLGMQKYSVSDISTITVDLPAVPQPIIFEQPQSHDVHMGETEVILSVNAYVEADPGLNGKVSYQWFATTQNSNENGSPIDGATAPQYKVPTNRHGSEFYYYARVYNTLFDGRSSFATSDVARIILRDILTPEITAPPEPSTNATVGEEFVLTVGASIPADQTPDGSTSNGVLSYQWWRSEDSVSSVGQPIVGATSSVLRVAEDHVGTVYYSVVVTNSVFDDEGDLVDKRELRSNTAQVVVDYPQAFGPVIIQEPDDVEGTVGDSVTVSILVDAPQPGHTTRFQWYKSFDGTSNFGGVAIDYAVDSDYVFALTDPGTFYLYVIVSNKVDGNPNPVTYISRVVEVTAYAQVSPNAGIAGKLGWIGLITGSVALMTAAFVMIIKKTA